MHRIADMASGGQTMGPRPVERHGQPLPRLIHLAVDVRGDEVRARDEHGRDDHQLGSQLRATQDRGARALPLERLVGDDEDAPGIRAHLRMRRVRGRPQRHGPLGVVGHEVSDQHAEREDREQHRPPHR